MLHPLGEAHAQDGEVGGAVTGATFFPNSKQVVHQHEPDRADDQHQVDRAAPTS